MTYYYIYKTINIINGKEYIGVHKTTKIRDGYIGNGIRSQKHAEQLHRLGNNTPFMRAVLKYGYDYFIKEVLYHFSSYREALEKEKELVNFEYIKRRDTYNIKEGGEQGGAIPTDVPYDVTNKEGGRFTGENSRLFCEEKGINYWHFLRLVKKQRNRYREYTLTEYYKSTSNYIVVNIQTDEVYKTNNLNEWCRENAPELVYKNSNNYLSKILNGESLSCKRKWWCCKESDWTGEVVIKTKKNLESCRVKDSNNKVYIVDNRTRFLKDHSLSKTQFYRLLRGEIEEYKGFKVVKQ